MFALNERGLRDTYPWWLGGNRTTETARPYLPHGPTMDALQIVLNCLFLASNINARPCCYQISMGVWSADLDFVKYNRLEATRRDKFTIIELILQAGIFHSKCGGLVIKLYII
jgi:hypothetical protein